MQTPTRTNEKRRRMQMLNLANQKTRENINNNTQNWPINQREECNAQHESIKGGAKVEIQNRK